MTTKVLVTERGALDHDVTATTPADVPDLRVVVMHGAALIGVRAARTFLQAFLAAFLGGIAGPTVPIVSDALPPSQFPEKLVAALYIGALAALISALQNAAELLAKLDAAHPEWRA